MSEAAIVLWILSIVAFTFNVAFVCTTIENIAKMKYGKEDPDNYLQELEKKLEANAMGIILDNNTH